MDLIITIYSDALTKAMYQMVGETLLYHHFLIPMENQCSIKNICNKNICNQWCYEILFSCRFLILYSANYTFSICRNFEKRFSEISGRIRNLTLLFFNCFSKRNLPLSFPLSNRKREARQKPNLSSFLQKNLLSTRTSSGIYDRSSYFILQNLLIRNIEYKWFVFNESRKSNN